MSKKKKKKKKKKFEGHFVFSLPHRIMQRDATAATADPLRVRLLDDVAGLTTTSRASAAGRGYSYDGASLDAATADWAREEKAVAPIFAMESNSRTVGFLLGRAKASPFKTFDPHLLQRSTVAPSSSDSTSRRRAGKTRAGNRLQSLVSKSYGKHHQSSGDSEFFHANRRPAARKLHHIFQDQAARLPAATVAVVLQEQHFTYAAIDALAEQIAAALRSAGVLPGSVVGLLLHRGVAPYAAMLGVHKAGSAYVPLDSSFPDSRVRFTLENSGTAALISSADIVDAHGRFTRTLEHVHAGDSAPGGMAEADRAQCALAAQCDWPEPLFTVKTVADLVPDEFRPEYERLGLRKGKGTTTSTTSGS